MDYSKLSQFAQQTQTGINNLSQEYKEQQKRMKELEFAINSKKQAVELVKEVHHQIFISGLQGRNTVVLYSKNEKDDTVLGNDLTDSHANIHRILTSVGLKDVRVENVDQYKVRCPDLPIPDECDTIISFSF